MALSWRKRSFVFIYIAVPIGVSSARNVKHDLIFFKAMEVHRRFGSAYSITT